MSERTGQTRRPPKLDPCLPLPVQILTHWIGSVSHDQPVTTMVTMRPANDNDCTDRLLMCIVVLANQRLSSERDYQIDDDLQPLFDNVIHSCRRWLSAVGE